MLGVVLYCPALRWVVQCPVQHNYYSLCIFFHLKLVKYGKYQSTFHSVKQGMGCGHTGPARCAGSADIFGIVMGNCVGECVEARSDLTCPQWY